MDFFTADPHFGHKNIIKFCDRPFCTLDGQPDVEAMNEALIRNWNERVTPDDHVYVLGDFAYPRRRAAQLRPILERLNGWKTLVRGNHDPFDDMMLMRVGFHEVFNGDPGRKGGLLYHDALLTHQPPTAQQWAEARERNPHLKYVIHGHVHDTWQRVGDFINAGVDVWDYRPVTLEELLACSPSSSPSSQQAFSWPDPSPTSHAA